MPEHLRALVVVLVLSGLVLVAVRPSFAALLDAATPKRWRNAWLGLTLLAFLAPNFWIFAAVVSLWLLASLRREIGVIAGFYLLVLFAVPPATIQVPGLGLINYLIELNYPRLLSLVLLAPAALLLRQQKDRWRLGATWPDKCLLAYVLLRTVLEFRATNVTNALRGCFYLLLDVWLPYYVVSRSVRSMEAFKAALSGMVLAGLLLAALAFFEYLKSWKLYSGAVYNLGLEWGIGNYQGRAGSLRASATLGHSIVFGYFMVVCLGLYFFLKEQVSRPWARKLGGLLLLGGLVASISRGPWVGAMACLLVFLATGPKALPKIAGVVAAGAASIPVLMMFPAGQKVVDLLPFIGTVEAENIDYRSRLLDNALIVIQRNLWLGSENYRDTPEMLEMIQGEGIIDIVNSYVAVALNSGMVGLALFLGVLLGNAWAVWQCQQRWPHGSPEKLLGRALLASMMGAMVTIFTVSSISLVPIVYWCLAGLCLAYTQTFRSRL